MTTVKSTVFLLIFLLISEVIFSQVNTRSKAYSYRDYPSVIDAESVSRAIKQRTQSVYDNVNNIQERINKIEVLNDNLQYVDESKYSLIVYAIDQLTLFLNSRIIDISSSQNYTYINRILDSYEDAIKKSFRKERIIIPIFFVEDGKWVKQDIDSQ